VLWLAFSTPTGNAHLNPRDRAPIAAIVSVFCQLCLLAEIGPQNSASRLKSARNFATHLLGHLTLACCTTTHTF